MKYKLSYGCHAWRPTLYEMPKVSSEYPRSMFKIGFKRINPINSKVVNPSAHLPKSQRALSYNKTKSIDTNTEKKNKK